MMTFYGNTALEWAIALGLATAIVMAALLARAMAIRHLEQRVRRTTTQIDDAFIYALKATRIWLVAVLALSAGSQGLSLPDGGVRAIGGVATVALFLQVGLWLSSLLKFWLTRSRDKANTAVAQKVGTVNSLSALGVLAEFLLWSVVALMMLDNLGVNVTALVAGLGIGGIAVALAVQNILGDLFASLSIVIDKPFVTGDFIIVDNFMGTVEHIGLKTTRMRSLDGEQIIFSNGDLLKTRLRNYKRMYERRVVFPLRVGYDTPPEQLEQIPSLIQKLIEGHNNTRFERSHFHRFGDSSLDFETVFWMTTPDYNVYMAVQQALNLQLMREFLKRGISFALPTSVAIAGARPARAERSGSVHELRGRS